jgi:transposase
MNLIYQSYKINKSEFESQSRDLFLTINSQFICPHFEKSRKSIPGINNPNNSNSYVGVDISKDKLDFFISDNSRFITISNSKIAIEKFIKSDLLKLDNPLVTCEATGGWERILLLQLASHNIHSHTAHATKIYHFAKSKGTLAKTDKLDAKTIASFAISEQLKPSSVHSPISLELKNLVMRKVQIKDSVCAQIAKTKKTFI